MKSNALVLKNYIINRGRIISFFAITAVLTVACARDKTYTEDGIKAQNQGNCRGAIDYFGFVVKNYPNSSFAPEARRRTLECEKSLSDAKDLISAGDKLISQEKFEEAAALYSQAKDKDPQSGIAENSIHTARTRAKESARKLLQSQNSNGEDLSKKALMIMLDGAPLLGALVASEGRSVKQGLASDYFFTNKARVGGGSTPTWFYKDAPDRSWFTVENTPNARVYRVNFQVGRPDQVGSYLVDIENGAIERKFDSFSAGFGH